MQLFFMLGAALLLVLLMSSPALDCVTRFMWGSRERKRWRDALYHLWPSEAGFTTTYCWPGGSTGQSTTAPTAAQASQVNLQTALVAIGDAETFAQFTHNWGLPASFPSFLFPLIFYRQSDIGTGPSTALAALTFSIANTNVVTVLKVAGVGNGGSFIVTLMRPTTLIR